MYIKKCNKNGKFFPCHFDETCQRPYTIQYSVWDFCLVFEQLLKFVKNPILIGISSDFQHNISTCISIRKCNKNEEFSPSHF